jgi:hypothetical protein
MDMQSELPPIDEDEKIDEAEKQELMDEVIREHNLGKKRKKSEKREKNSDDGKEKDEKKSNNSKSTGAKTLTRRQREKIEAYLLLWTEQQEEKKERIWRFSTVTQSSLLHVLFEKTEIPKWLFKIAVPYVATIKGAARQRVLDAAKAINDEFIGDDSTRPFDEQLARLEKKKEGCSEIQLQNMNKKILAFKARHKRAKIILEALI